MKHIFVLAFLVCLSGCFSQKVLVKYEMKQTIPYCGGARPTPEILEKSKIPVPYANKTLLFISQNKKADSLITSSNGSISKKLSKGTYYFFEPWKFHKQTPDGSSIDNFDKNCLEQEWKKPDLIITVKKGQPEITNNITSAKCPWNLSCLIKKQQPE